MSFYVSVYRIYKLINKYIGLYRGAGSKKFGDHRRLQLGEEVMVIVVIIIIIIIIIY
jgi:hypothetical protein